MRRSAVLAAITVLSVGAQPRQKPFWLDIAPKQWNHAGGSIPRAQKLFSKDDRDFLDQCRGLIVADPQTPEERAVAGKGWVLFGSTHDGRGTAVVSAMQNFDGMCRPDNFQDFVFVKGIYAGTISPKPMNSRSDGASTRIDFPDRGKVYAEFVRYTEKDPLCCPSRISEATYEIQEVNGKPLVTLTTVRTRPTN
jgi:hypothetical protein